MFPFRNSLQVWFQNRRAKFRKQERIAQQKVSSHSNSSSEHQSNNNNNVKLEMKSQIGGGGNTTPIKDIIKPSSPISTVSTTPNSNASSHPSDSHNMKSINGTYLISPLLLRIHPSISWWRMIYPPLSRFLLVNLSLDKCRNNNNVGEKWRNEEVYMWRS